jgi:chorismate synthase
VSLTFTTAGESHGPALVTIVEGLPAGLAVDKQAVDHQLWRRQLGYGRGGRMKIERDEVEILSGVRHGETLGSPVALLIRNRDHENWLDVMSAEPRDVPPERARRVTRPRPGHADLVGGLKYDRRDLRDVLERASARETAARVAAGALARLLIAAFGVEIASHVVALGPLPERMPDEPVAWDVVRSIGDERPLRCADESLEARMVEAVDEARRAGDTLGGVFEVVARGLPPGLGAHTSWREKLDGRLAQAVMSIQAVKGVEVGDGVGGARRPGSLVHDEIVYNDGGLGFRRSTNRAGGLEGGVTTGEELRVRGHLKPISTLRKRLRSVDIDTKEVSEAAFERSDVTAVPAAGVIGEAMVALVLAGAFREKFGGDSLVEMRRNVEGYLEQIGGY